MDRRGFLHLTGSVAAIGTSAACAPARRPASPDAAGATAAVGVEEATIAELGARMASGALTAAALVDAYLARIETIDRAGPTLRSVLELDPDARAIAARLDDERRTRGARGPMHGIPVLIKDNVDTGDRMQTTAGSLALLGTPAKRDAHLVARLREAGAVVLGKTNLSEWANIRDEHSTSGWSARGGRTRHPYVLDRNPSGSSSGSAVAVAANLVAVAVGTETEGSIISPASICGIVGLKPTVGLVSRAGVIPISHTQDTAGPMARTVADAAILLGAMAGIDPADPATSGARVERDYTRSLDPAGARGARLGVVRGLPWVTPALQRPFDAALDDLRRLGAVLVDVTLPSLEPIRDSILALLLFELKADLASYLAKRGHPAMKSLDDVVRFNAAHPSEEMPWFGQSLFEKAAKKGGLDDPSYRQALADCRRLSREEGIDAALQKDSLDALVAPTGGVAWVTDLVNGDSGGAGSEAWAALAGYPNLTVPSGVVHGLPVGISFFAGAFAEPTLLRIGHAYERATQRRIAPRYLPTMA